MSHDNNKELDEFWDIRKLIPQKPKADMREKPTAASLRMHLISCQPPTSSEVSANEQNITVSPVKTPAAPTVAPSAVFREYREASPLILKVSVLNWKSTYNYYETFCRQAISLQKRHGTPCEAVPFFSYVAQYSQLNRAQLNWYLWWRDNVRTGKYPETDVSYIYLLIFEIINLGSAIDPQAAVDTLIGLWSHYRNIYPQLNTAMADWICDYCLIHELSVSLPDTRITREMISVFPIPELFFKPSLSDPSHIAKLLVAFCTSYQYQKSKFYTEEHKRLYDTHIPGALAHLLSQMDLPAFLTSLPKKRVSRVAFTGALCSYLTRKHIEVDMISLCDSKEIKGRLGEVIKYSENRLREHLGIRSKLGVPALKESAKHIIDRYFDSVLPSVRKPQYEYEKLYDAKTPEFSFTSALDIERRSWEVTEKLVQAFDGPEEIAEQEFLFEPSLPEHPKVGTDTPVCEFLSAIIHYRDFFALVLAENIIEQKKYLRENHLLADAVVDEINQKAADILGDIVIEDGDDGYCIIEDYRSMFEEESI